MTKKSGDNQAASAFDQPSVLSRLCHLQPWTHPGAVYDNDYEEYSNILISINDSNSDYEEYVSHRDR